MSAKVLVDEQVKSLSSICDLESDVTQAFHAALLQVAERHLANLSTTTTAASTGEKIKIGKKAGAKRVTKTKEDKLSSKNAYHFFVAAKMGEVKAAGVEAKGRMKRIGEMWKALSEDERKPYKDMAARYNEHVQGEMKTADWKARRDAIVAAANQHATSGTGAVVVESEGGDEEEEEDDVDETETVVSVAPVVPTPVPTPAPVVQAPAPVQQAAAPVRRRAAAKKN